MRGKVTQVDQFVLAQIDNTHHNLFNFVFSADLELKQIFVNINKVQNSLQK